MSDSNPASHEKENPDSVGAEIGVQGIEALPKRVNRYGKAKNNALDIAKYIEGQGLAQRAVRLLSCGDYLVFRHYFTQDIVRLHSARLCMQHLLCPLCAIRRGAKALKGYLDRWEVIQADNGALRPFLVTLTVKDGPDLAERFEHLHTAQRELWKRRQRGRGSALDGVAGAVWSYEVKRGSGSGAWHPHLHMIALAENMPDQQELADEWHNITGDSFIVDVRPISQEDPVSGFVEVFKYAVKFSEQEPADTMHAFMTLRGKRLLECAGLFRGVEVPQGGMDDHEDVAHLPYYDLLYRFSKAGGYSLEHRSSVQQPLEDLKPVRRVPYELPDWVKDQRRFFESELSKRIAEGHRPGSKGMIWRPK